MMPSVINQANGLKPLVAFIRKLEARKARGGNDILVGGLGDDALAIEFRGYC